MNIMNITPGLLFSAPGLGKYISGAILYEETLFQSSTSGTPFVDLLKSNGVFPGIKVDTGLQPLPGADPIETWYVQYLLTLLSYLDTSSHWMTSSIFVSLQRRF